MMRASMSRHMPGILNLRNEDDKIITEEVQMIAIMII